MLEIRKSSLKRQSEYHNQTQIFGSQTQIWELRDREFKLDVINMIRAPMEKANNTLEKIGNVKRDMDTVRKHSSHASN